MENPLPAVLVVGAGPTGLTLATLLARYGVAVRIVERKDRLSRHTKATNLMQRSQEIVAALGLLEPLSEIGGPMRRMMVHAYGKCLGPRTMRLRESPFTDVVLCGQHNLEAAMARGLSAAGGEVEFGTELAGLVQDADGATATLRRDGGLESARFAYVVGCDGHAGITRAFTRHDFQPVKTGVAIRQVDCRLSWGRLSTMDQMWLFYFDGGFAVVVPLPGGVHRILTVEPKGAFPAREPTLDEMQAALRTAASDPGIVLSEPDWSSHTDLSMGLAGGLRDGRILLAGDAGNPVLPNGGQGMNTGIQDAFNLGWKLAAVLRHGGSQALLDSYEAERHAHRAALQRVERNSLTYTTLKTPRAMRAAFRLLAEPLLDAGGEYRMAQAFSELTLHVRKGPLTLEALRAKGVRAGDRALDAAVVLDRESARLYGLLYRGGWTLLAFAGRARRSDPDGASRAVEDLRRPGLAAYVVSTEALAGRDVLHDLDEEAHRAYGIVRPTLLLVRPDGHVGARAAPDDSARLAAYMARWLPDAGQAFRPTSAARDHGVPTAEA